MFKTSYIYFNFQALKLRPVIYLCFTSECLRTSYDEMHPHIFLAVLRFTTGQFSSLQSWIHT